MELWAEKTEINSENRGTSITPMPSEFRLQNRSEKGNPEKSKLSNSGGNVDRLLAPVTALAIDCVTYVDNPSERERVKGESSSGNALTCVQWQIMALDDIDVDVDNPVDRKLVKDEEHAVPLDDNSEPHYHGIAVMKDGKLVLCEYTWLVDTSHLCVYNPLSRNLLCLKTDTFVHSAVQIDDTHLAVSMPFEKSIALVSINTELKVEKTLKTTYTPYCMVALSNGQLVITWTGPPAFGVIDISGDDVVEMLYMDHDMTERKFKSFEFLAVDEERRHVIQPCADDKAVYCFDLEGCPVFMYSHPDLTCPRGVALDRCGNMYVCDCDNNTIHQVSPTGDPIRVITRDVGLPTKPWDISSDVKGTGFWVTCFSSPLGTIVHYKIE